MTDRAIRDFCHNATGASKFYRGSYPSVMNNAAGRVSCYQDAEGNLVECAAQVGDFKYYENREKEARDSKAGENGRSGSK